MNKKLQNGLVAAVSAAMGTGIVAPVIAAAATTGTNLDAQYAEAYNATQKALASKDQKDLTAARVLVDGLYQAVKGTPNEYLGTTLSSLLDPAQQLKLDELFKAMDKATTSLKQADINASRDLLLAMPSQWVNSFSTANDAIQQKLIDKVKAAVEKAEASGLETDKTDAQTLVADIKTATNNAGVVTWATAMGTRADAVVTTLKVSSVSASNLKQIVVTFNQKVDEDTATDAANYAGIPLDATVDPVLQDDGKTVVLTTNATMAAFTEYTLTVSNVKGLSGNKITPVATAFKPNDLAVPVVSSVTTKGNSKIVVAFNEPVQQIGAELTGNYTLDGKALPALSTATLSADKTKVTIVLPAPMLLGQHSLAVVQQGATKIADFANYNVVVSTSNISVTADTEVPQVVSFVANSQTKATIKFSEGMATLTNANFYWNTTGVVTDSSKTATSVKKVDDSTWEINFTANYMPEGKVYLFAKNESDLNGNIMAGNVAANTFKGEATVTANVIPTVATVTAKDDSNLVVTFSDKVDNATINNSNFVIKDSDGNTVSQATTTLDTLDTNKKVTINFSAPLAGGSYSVAVKNVKDLVGNKLADATNSVSVVDTTQPSGAAVAFKGQSIVVTYNEAMATSGTNSALDINNYKLDNGSGYAALPAGTYITQISSKQFRITTPATTTLNPTDSLKIGYFDGSKLYTVADLAGNLYTPANTAAVGLAKGAVDISSSTGAKLSILDANTLQYTLPTDQSALSTVLPTDFELTVDGFAHVIRPVSATLNSTGTKITFKVSDDDKFTAANTGVGIQVQTKAIVTGTKDVYDSYVAISKQTALGAPVISNKIAASLKAVAVKDASHVIVTTNGQMAATQGTAMASSLQVVQDGKVVAITSVNQDTTSQFTIDLGSNVVDLSKDVTVRTVGKDFITAQDQNSNMLVENTTGLTTNTVAAVDLSVDLSKGSSPTNLDSLDQIVVTYNRAIDPASIVDSWDGSGTKTVTLSFATDGTLTVNGAKVGTVNGFTVSAAEDVTADLTYNAVAKTLTITVNDTIVATITDAGANTFTSNADVKSISGSVINKDFKITK